VLGWHVANKRPTGAGAKRQRRAVHRLTPSATPVVSVSPPTSRPVPTHTVREPEPTRVPPSRSLYTTPSVTFLTTTDPEQRRTRRRRTRRPRPGRSTSPVVADPTYTVPTTHIEPSVSGVPTTRQVVTATPPLPPTRVSDLHWTGRPLRLDLYSNEIVHREVPDNIFEGGAPGGLRLRLLTADGLVVSQWLRLDDSTNRS